MRAVAVAIETIPMVVIHRRLIRRSSQLTDIVVDRAKVAASAYATDTA